MTEITGNGESKLRPIEGLDEAFKKQKAYAALEQLTHGMGFLGYYSPEKDQFMFGASREPAVDDIPVFIRLAIPKEAIADASKQGKALPPLIIIDFNATGTEDVQHLKALKQRLIEHNKKEILTYLKNGGDPKHVVNSSLLPPDIDEILNQ